LEMQGYVAKFIFNFYTMPIMKNYLIPVLALSFVFFAFDFKKTPSDLPINRVDVHWIEVGKTSQVEILEKFGEPNLIQGNSKEIMWEYRSPKTNLTIRMEVESKLVQDYMFRQNSDQAADLKYDELDVSIFKDMAVTDLVAKFGHPTIIEIGPKDEQWTYRSPLSKLNLIIDRENEKVLDFDYRFERR
jgi:hypothetical protein